MHALFLFDYTGIMAKPWLDAGYTCTLVDQQHKKGYHRDAHNPLLYRYGFTVDNSSMLGIADAFYHITSHVMEAQLVFGFPECTDLAVSGASRFKNKFLKDPEFQDKAMRSVKLVEKVGDYFNCPWALENPVSVISTKWRKPDHIFHPYEYGGYLPEDDEHPIYPRNIAPRDAYPKRTCIWCGNGFVMPPVKIVQPEDGDSRQYSNRGGKSLKTKNIRSATPRGFSKAVFEYNKVK